MSQQFRPGAAGTASTPETGGVDKLDLHHRQQLSALVDGELAPDEARFLWRRLEHDRELVGHYERWQLCGQVLRREAVMVAAPDFSERVATALRLEAAQAAPVAVQAGRRGSWARWGGGAAALAASVAAVALLVNRPQAPDAGYSPAMQAVVAGRAQPPAAPATQASTAVASVDVGQVVEPAAVPALAAAPSRPAPAQPVQREAVRALASAAPDRPAVDGVARTTRATQPPAAAEVAAVAQAEVAAPFAAASDPFATPMPLQARPWPRAALPQGHAAGGYTASFESGGQARTFYPFEPNPHVAEADEAVQHPPGGEVEVPR